MALDSPDMATESSTASRRRRKEASIDERLTSITQKLELLSDAVNGISALLMQAPPGLPHHTLPPQTDLEKKIDCYTDRLDKLASLVSQIPDMELFSDKLRGYFSDTPVRGPTELFNGVEMQPDAELSPMKDARGHFLEEISVDIAIQTELVDDNSFQCDASVQTTGLFKLFPEALRVGDTIISRVSWQGEAGQLLPGYVGEVIGAMENYDPEDGSCKAHCCFDHVDKVFGLNIPTQARKIVMEDAP